MNHEYFMHHCLALAKKGRGLVGGNPLVGSVLVRSGTIIAEGVYMGEGAPHAERSLFEGFSGEIEPEDILYVNLEPCCHHGSTPPCTDFLIKQGVQTVVVGMKDPDRRVAGKGTKALRDAGVHVIGPVLPELCRRINKGFVSLREKNRPYITLKRAQTKEGAIAHPDGSKLCITSDEQNTWSHTHLRSTHDAILIGVQTIITDNPQLTIRLGPNRDSSVQPVPIILDPMLRTPKEANVVRSGTIIVTTKQSTEYGEATLVQIPYIDEQFDLPTLWKALPHISSILVEGGKKTWDAFLHANMVDEEVILIG